MVERFKMSPEARRRLPKNKPNKGGRPRTYEDDNCDLAYKFCLLGATEKQLAEFFGVVKETIDVWIATKEDFATAVRAGRARADANVAKSMYHRANGYSHKAVKIFMTSRTTRVSQPSEDNPKKMVTITETVPEVVQVPFTEHYPPDTPAGVFWLTNRQRHMWKQRVDSTVANPDDTPLAPPTIVINPVRPKETE